MNCSSPACASDCVTCHGRVRADVRRALQVSHEPLSSEEELLLQEYQATLGQRKTVNTAVLPVHFVCELARSLS